MNKFVMQGRWKEINGSITNPENSGLRLVVNLCSESGKWESPVETLLSKRWAPTKTDYRSWYVNRQGFKLGSLNTTLVASDIWVVNLLCKDKDNKVDDKALSECVKKLSVLARSDKGSVHFSSTALQEVPELQDMLKKTFIEEGFSVYSYTEATKT